MRRHAKASSAGSTDGTGSSRAQVRRSFVTRGASGRFGRNGASSRRAPLAFLGALVLAITVSLGAASAIADTPPSVTIDSPPTAITYTTAHVSGTVNPQGGPSATSWHFEFTTDPVAGSWEYAYSASGEISGAEAEGTTPVPVGGELEGLSPGATYYVRLVAENEAGANSVATVAPYPSLTTVAVTPPSISIDPPTLVTGTTAHFSGEINPEGTDPTSDVLWDFECTPGCPTTLHRLPADTDGHVVEEDIKGLQPNTEYEVRLVGYNAGESVTAGPEIMNTPTTRPLATTIPAFALAGGTKALLGGRINPTNQATVYWFEYGADDSYGTSVPVSRDASAGAGGQDTTLTQEVSGLTPRTTYHYRVVAENPTGPAEGSDRTFTTGPRAAEPEGGCSNDAVRALQSSNAADCRAWEMVSPVAKNFSDAGTNTWFPTPVATSPNGDAAVYFSNVAYADAKSAQPGGAYLAKRGSGDWLNQGILPRVDVTMSIGTFSTVSHFISTDLSKTLVTSSAQLTSNTPPGPKGAVNLYIRDNVTETYQLVSVGSPPDEPEYGYPAPEAVAVTPDFKHVLFRSVYRYTDDAIHGATFGAGNLYQWNADEPETVNLVGYLPNDSVEPGGASPGGSEGPGSGATLVDHAISEDGSRVFFSSPVPPQNDTSTIYVRKNGTSTTKIAENANYWSATPDGSKALFTDSDGVKLYDVATETTTNISPDLAPEDGSNPRITGIIQKSEDLSRVYFMAEGLLVPGEGMTGERAYNIYLSEDGVVSYIGTQNEDDFNSGIVLGYRESFPYSSTSENQSAVTPDGNRFAFASRARQTAYNSDGHSEVYLYDADNKELSCASCPEAGRAAHGDAQLIPPVNGTLRGFVIAITDRHSLSRDGSRLFFQTTDALSPDDTNGASDIYEASGGRTQMITPGVGDSEQGYLFGGASSSGDDVFFGTRNQVVARDVDQLSDLYDARVNGGIAAQNSTSSVTAPCEGQQCRGASSTAPATSAPASREIRDAKNATPKKHKKPKHKGKRHKKKQKKHKGKQHKKKHKASHRAQTNG